MVVMTGGKVCRPEVAGDRIVTDNHVSEEPANSSRSMSIGTVSQKSPPNYSYANAWNALRDTESRACGPQILHPACRCGGPARIPFGAGTAGRRYWFHAATPSFRVLHGPPSTP